MSSTSSLALEAPAEATQLHEQISAYASQVTLDFEELSWLREIAGQLDLCRVDSSVDDVAQEVLPSLSEVVGAEALVLFFADHPESAVEIGDYRFAAFGNRIPDEAPCRHLIVSLRARAEQQPVVINDPERLVSLAAPRGTSSLLLVSLTRHGIRFGWLLALNKKSTPPHGGRQLLGEDEFGTIEAGMLGAAATLLSTHARNVHLFRAKERLLVGTVRALVNAIDAKDHYTRGHSDRVAEFSRCIARRLGLSHHQCEEVYMTGLLHDIGKIGVRDAVLSKPGRLTEEEFAQIRLHPEIGYQILKNLTPLSYALPGVLHHHEAVDGSGYPYGLSGDEIPLYARILAVGDAYDAMTSDRPYRGGMSTERAESILRDGAGKQWDAVAIDAFFAVIGEIRSIMARSKACVPDPLKIGCEEDSARDSIATAVAETHA